MDHREPHRNGACPWPRPAWPVDTAGVGILQIHTQIGCQEMGGHWHNYLEALRDPSFMSDSPAV